MISRPSRTDAEVLRLHLGRLCESVLDKTDGLGERDLRSPRTPTGTNLLGLLKHLSGCLFAYFGTCFDRPHGRDLGFLDGEPNEDMWATPEESAQSMRQMFRDAAAFADLTLREVPLDRLGHVPWWAEPEASLHTVTVHVIAEVAQHLGQIDILREQIDAVAGYRPRADNLPWPVDDPGWAEYRARLQEVADRF